ncbi:MAG: chemotaxis protein CheA [Phycisphaerales bacterium JB054]
MTASSRVRELIELLKACGPADRRALAMVCDELAAVAAALDNPAAPPPLDPATVAGLVDEASEHFAATERALLALAADPGDAASLDACLRGLHSVKGAAGFLRLGPAVRVLHAAESLLDAARAGATTLTPDRIHLLRQCSDAVAACLETGQEINDPARRLLDALADELQSATAQAPNRGVGARPAPARAQLTKPASAPPERIFRISAHRADALAALVRDLEADARALHHDRESRLDRLADTIARLREQVDALRLSSLHPTVQNLRRLVHDLSSTLGKPISLHAEGADTEFDRSVVEALADPLRHLVRNACDHGIEAAPERRASGKPPEGRISLRVLRSGGSIVVEVGDDGRGLDRQRILDHAVAGGLLTAREAGASLPDDELCRLVLAPGFTTAPHATEVSGCGFGLDIVHRRIATLGGTLEIRSAAGRGMVVRIAVPLVPDARVRPDPRDAAA